MRGIRARAQAAGPDATDLLDPDESWDITVKFAWVAKMCMKMLQKDPSKRPSAGTIREWTDGWRLPSGNSRGSEGGELSSNNSRGTAAGSDPGAPGEVTLRLTAVDVVDRLTELEAQIKAILERPAFLSDGKVAKIHFLVMSRSDADQGGSGRTNLEYRVTGLGESAAGPLAREIEGLKRVQVAEVC